MLSLVVRAFIIIPILSLLSVISFAQEPINKTVIAKDAAGNPIRRSADKDELDEFGGCIEVAAAIDNLKWNNYLSSNLVLDDQSLDTIPAGRYEVIVQFVIDKDGIIEDPLVIKDPGYGLSKRVIAVLLNYNERWKPAIQSGRSVKSYRKQPITFVVEKSDVE